MSSIYDFLEYPYRDKAWSETFCSSKTEDVSYILPIVWIDDSTFLTIFPLFNTYPPTSGLSVDAACFIPLNLINDTIDPWNGSYKVPVCSIGFM